MELMTRGGFRVKNQTRIQNLQGEGSGCMFVIKIPHSRVFRVLSRSLFLALVIVTLPCLRLIILNSTKNVYKIDSDPINGQSLPLIFKDLMNEGILKSGDKGMIFGSQSPSTFEFNDGLDLISESDIESQNSIQDDTFDFVLVSKFSTVTFIDRTLKTGGIAIIQLSDNPSNNFDIPLNYKIKYFRRFECTILALRKIGEGDSIRKSPTKRRLFGFDSIAKEDALKGLEDVLLEPPRDGSMNFNKYMKRTKFLPELMSDSLDGYPRLVFIDVGSSSESSLWFKKNYPTRNRDFEMYKIEMMSEKVPGKEETRRALGMSEWLMKNVREEEFVVMKAEAEVVEEMLKNRSIYLVDELFLECSNQWQNVKKKKSRRAYWECLALYGRLRDEGIAVHQWWS